MKTLMFIWLLASLAIVNAGSESSSSEGSSSGSGSSSSSASVDLEGDFNDTCRDFYAEKLTVDMAYIVEYNAIMDQCPSALDLPFAETSSHSSRGKKRKGKKSKKINAVPILLGICYGVIEEVNTLKDLVLEKLALEDPENPLLEGEPELPYLGDPETAIMEEIEDPFLVKLNTPCLDLVDKEKAIQKEKYAKKFKKSKGKRRG